MHFFHLIHIQYLLHIFYTFLSTLCPLFINKSLMLTNYLFPEGRSLAKDRGCKFIETSVAINHQVDELLVGTLTQIRIKARVADKLKKKRDSGPSRRSSIYTGGAKASGVLKKILRRACLKSKSCDNLHVL